MTGGWDVYIRTGSIEEMTVPRCIPSALHPSSFTYAYDTGIVRAYAYFVFVIC